MARTLATVKPAGRPERRSLVELEPKDLEFFLESEEYSAFSDLARKCDAFAGNALDLHWLKDSESSSNEELARELSANCDLLVVLAGPAATLAMRAPADWLGVESNLAAPRLVYAGEGLDEDSPRRLAQLGLDRELRVGALVISHGAPSPALRQSFGLLEQALATRYREPELLRRIVLLSDERGAELTSRAYRRVSLPDKLRPPLLMLTMVSLFGIWLAGMSATQFCEGLQSQVRSAEKFDPGHPGSVYALLRLVLLRDLGARECFVAPGPNQEALGRWWLHLMSESSRALMQGRSRGSELCLGSELQLPGSGKHFAVLAECREPVSGGEHHFNELSRLSLDGLLSQREAVGSLRLVLPRRDLFSLGALVGFFAGVAAVSERILEKL